MIAIAMYDHRAEAERIATMLREHAGLIPPGQRLTVPGAAKEVLGLRKPELLAFTSAWLASHVEPSGSALLETCHALWCGQTREEQFVATRLLARREAGFGAQGWESVQQWIEGVDSVESGDWAAIYVVAPWAAAELESRVAAVRALLERGDPIQRRIALVVTTAIRQCDDYANIAQEFVHAAAPDREALVIDAVVWALCALSRHHRPIVEELIRTSNELAPFAKEQVVNWLQTGSRTGVAVRSWRLPQPGAVVQER